MTTRASILFRLMRKGFLGSTHARFKLSGSIQLIQLNILKAVKRYCGNQKYTNMAVKVMTKNLSWDILKILPQGLWTAVFLSEWKVLLSATVTKLAGQIQ